MDTCLPQRARRIRAITAGIILYNKGDREVLVVRNSYGNGNGKYGFPKGRCLEGEHTMDGALRYFERRIGVEFPFVLEEGIPSRMSRHRYFYVYVVAERPDIFYIHKNEDHVAWVNIDSGIDVEGNVKAYFRCIERGDDPEDPLLRDRHLYRRREWPEWPEFPELDGSTRPDSDEDT